MGSIIYGDGLESFFEKYAVLCKLLLLLVHFSMVSDNECLDARTDLWVNSFGTVDAHTEKSLMLFVTSVL